MALSGNFLELRDNSDELSRELDCGWNGFPQNGGINVKFYDKDEDDFEWLLELDFQPESAGALSMGGTATLNGATLKVLNNGVEMEHSINTNLSNLTSFAHIAAVVLQVRKMKPQVTPAEKAAKLAAKTQEAVKKQMENMGIKIGNK